MSKGSDPESRPITVSELIARAEGNEAFPRSASMSVRASEGTETAGTGLTASGMPPYQAPNTTPDAPQAVGASGMPGYTPPTPDATITTGVIPVVDEMADTGSLRPVDGDDVFAFDLPPAEVRSNPSALDQPIIYSGTATSTPAEDLVGWSALEGVATSSDSSIGDVAAPEMVTVGDLVAEDSASPAVDADADAVDAAPDSDSADEVAEAKAAEEAEAAAAKAKAAEEKAAAAAERDAEKARKREAKQAAKAAKAAERESGEPSSVRAWLLFIGELVLGLAIGAGLFWGFTELWKQYIYIALILAIVVIFAIVTFAHVLRKRDLPTTLLALGVGMLVTMGPLVLLATQP